MRVGVRVFVGAAQPFCLVAFMAVCVCMSGYISAGISASVLVCVCVLSLTILCWPPFCFLSCETRSLFYEHQLSLRSSFATAFHFRFLITRYSLPRNENIFRLTPD